VAVLSTAGTAPPPRVAERILCLHIVSRRGSNRRTRAVGDRDSTKPCATVIGVVGDIRPYGEDHAPGMMADVAQARGGVIGYYRLVARTTVPPLGLEWAVRAVDPMLPVYHVKSLEEYPASTAGSPDRHVGVARMVRIAGARTGG
jgi:hypothetical protein